MTRNYSEEDSVKKGLASLAVALGASEGDVAQIDANGNVTLAPGNGGSVPAVGAMLTGMAATNTDLQGQFLTKCSTVVYDTGGCVDDTDPTESALVAPSDGLYIVTWNALMEGAGLGQITIGNGGADNNWIDDRSPSNTGAQLWLAITQVVRLRAGNYLFATATYSEGTGDTRLTMGGGDAGPTGGFTLTRVCAYPT